jgi:UDP-N-acetyl-D-mannosaminuronate dehydrogenase
MPKISTGKYDGNRDIARKVRSGEFKIAVYGLGHVGSPLASAWLRAGAHVIAVDKSPKVLENARKGRTHLPEPRVNEAFSKGLKDNRLSSGTFTWCTARRESTRAGR